MKHFTLLPIVMHVLVVIISSTLSNLLKKTNCFLAKFECLRTIFRHSSVLGCCALSIRKYVPTFRSALLLRVKWCKEALYTEYRNYEYIIYHVVIIIYCPTFVDIIIIIGTTAPFEPRPSSEASASCPYPLQHSSNFSPPTSWHLPSHHLPISVSTCPSVFFLLPLQRELFL